MKGTRRNKNVLNIKFNLEGLIILSYDQLLQVNGAGGSGSSGGGGGSPSGSSASSSSPSSSSSTPSSSSSTSSSSSGKGSSQSSPSQGSSDSNSEKVPTTQNAIDNTKNSEIVDKFTSSGYELLSDKKDNIYTEGSRKEYIQSEFENFSSNKDSFNVVKVEGRYEGVSDGVHSYNDYDIYTVIGKDGKTYMEALDINRDGKIDYVK